MKKNQYRATDLLIPDEISETLTRRLDESKIDIPASFSAELVRRTKKKQHSNLPEWCLNDKAFASSFALSRGLNLPKTLQDRARLAELKFLPNTVIKRLSGSGGAGVYLYFSDNHIISMKTRKIIRSLNDLKSDMNYWVAAAADDNWRVEELIFNHLGETAHDLKFYCFYGVVGLVLEVRRWPDLSYCWWTTDGNKTSVGKYEEESFEGRGITSHQLETARELSLSIPAPFVRIDFLAGADGLYFGEFTPRPGSFHKFTRRFDRVLGDLFLEAEVRLERDLMIGKTFGIFKEMKL